VIAGPRLSVYGSASIRRFLGVPGREVYLLGAADGVARAPSAWEAATLLPIEPGWPSSPVPAGPSASFRIRPCARRVGHLERGPSA